MSYTKSFGSFLVAAIAAAPALVSAHGHVTQVSVNGEVFPGFTNGNPDPASVGWATTVQDNGFVSANALGDADIVCHRGATPAANSVTVAAGDSLTITWDTWPDSHVGPIIDYLANCDGDCSSVEKTALEFFKINEGGLIDGTDAPGFWVANQLIEDDFSWTTTIPPSVAPGSYVLRHEIIALHEGNLEGGAQMYPQCINIEVTGSGTAQPAGVVATELYTASDPGIFFNPYQPNLEYPMPGPENSFADGSAPAPAPPAGGDDDETEAPPAPQPTVSPPAEGGEDAPSTTLSTSTRVAEPTQAPPADGGCTPGGNNGGSTDGAQPLYAQCGGQNFSGSTTCAQGTCTEINPYYSQCLIN